MASPATPDHSNSSPGTEDENEASAEADESSDPVVRLPVPTRTCPNCDRTFTGSYCPNCGQEAGHTLSATDVIGGFFRELVDIEHGVWGTVKALTRRPGSALQDYLSGARGALMNPGRYLLAAIVVNYLTFRGLSWLGVKESYADWYQAFREGTSGEGAVAVALERTPALVSSQWFMTTISLLLAGLLAFSYRRMFADRLRSAGEALAVGAFIVGHATVVETVVRVVYIPLVFAWTGEPAPPMVLMGFLATTTYIGIATGLCFGPFWKGALKGLFGAVLANVESIALVTICIFGYSFWRAGQTMNPDVNLLVVFLVTSAVYSVPLLVHLGVEAYYRLR